ncbi:MAG: bifunctional 5,10-methylenetetrahydrofolate dehydrogenase/5,10-methenyltetrahydrofolate cyclohydrolase [Patescibacteria group bacterium]
MAIIFDGKTYSLKKKELLRAGTTLLREKGIIPHMATILIGDDIASSLYVNLKKKFIESIGCQLDIYNLTENTKLEDIELLIKTLNEDNAVHGIMIQMPIPQIISGAWPVSPVNSISSNKDIDGLKENSKFVHPTAKAVTEIMSLAVNEIATEIKTVCVVGSSGMVGKSLVHELKRLGYEVTECDKDTDDLAFKTVASDCIVSSTGVMNLITPNMVKNEAVLIDIGSPVGDISPLCEEKASFITPVPGGVGPVTITCLAENLLLAAS